MDIFSLVGKITIDGMGKANTQLTGLQGKFQKVSKGFKIAGATMVGTAVGIGVASLKMAGDFDGAMREANTMMLLNEEEFKLFSKDVQNLAKDMGVDATESAKALYQAISAGVPKENAVEFLAIASKAAIGGVTDTVTAVDGLTTIINAFKLPMEDAQHVSDVMFATVKGGKTTMEELSASMFQVAPMAAASGVSFETVSAALATMTKQGVPTSVATTQLRQAIQAMIKPTADMKTALGGLGYASGDALIAEKGLAGALDLLTEASGGSNEVLGKMFGSVEGLQAVLALTGENAQVFAADIEAIDNAAGAATDAFDQMEKSTARQMEKMQVQMKDMAITIGMALMPALTKILEIIMPIVAKIGDWISEHPKLTALILAGVAVLGGLLLVAGPILSVITMLTAALPFLGMAFTAMLGPVGLIILAIAAVIAIGVLVYKNWDKIKAKAGQLGDGLRRTFTRIKNFFVNIWGNIINIFKKHWGKILAIIFPAVGLPILIARNWGPITKVAGQIWDKVKSVFSKAWKTAKEWGINLVKGLWEGMKSLDNWIWDKVTKFAKNIWKSIRDGLGDLWPFSPSEAGVDIGRGLTEGIQVGIERTLKNIRSAMQDMRAEVSPGVIAPGLTSTPAQIPSVGGAGVGITNIFNIAEMVVREEADIGRIARKLYQLQQSKARLVGV